MGSPSFLGNEIRVPVFRLLNPLSGILTTHPSRASMVEKKGILEEGQAEGAPP